jgi:hypothetical protein
MGNSFTQIHNIYNLYTLQTAVLTKKQYKIISVKEHGVSILRRNFLEWFPTKIKMYVQCRKKWMWNIFLIFSQEVQQTMENKKLYTMWHSSIIPMVESKPTVQIHIILQLAMCHTCIHTLLPWCNFNTNFTIFRNVQIFQKKISKQKIYVKENIESSRIFNLWNPKFTHIYFYDKYG